MSSELTRGFVPVLRGSLELGDIFSDISANSLEMTLLGCSGQVRTSRWLEHLAAHVSAGAQLGS